MQPEPEVAVTAADPTGAADPTSATAKLYSRALSGCGSPTGVEELCAVLGIDTTAGERLKQLDWVGGGEVGLLLDLLPDFFRSATRYFTGTTERCVGGIRGPIHWGETMTAWSSGIGVNEVFVCEIPTRDYETDENQLIAWLLSKVASAQGAVNSAGSLHFNDAQLGELKTRIRTARRLLSEEPLKHASRRRPRSRELRAFTSPRSAGRYGPVLAVRERLIAPLPAQQIEAFASPATRAEHQFFLALLEMFESITHTKQRVRVTELGCSAGPLTYVSGPMGRGPAAGSYLAGVRIGASGTSSALSAAQIRSILEEFLESRTSATSPGVY